MKKITLILAFIFYSIIAYTQIGTYTFDNVYYIEADSAFVGTAFKIQANLCFSRDKFDLTYTENGANIFSVLSGVPLKYDQWTEETSFDDYVVYSQKAYDRTVFYIWYNKTSNTVFKMFALDFLDAAIIITIDEKK